MADDTLKVDPVDRDLLQMLLDNARIPDAVLARQLNLEPDEVERRIQRLEEIGIIKAYRAVVDPYLYSLYFYEHGPLGLKAQAARSR
jgi:Lrp/AsnC family leucine-responsive transcriptional regulator